ncbi:putative lipoprotein MlpA [Myxococcus xanthus DK 1622]|uniref:Putative lipoprotein MlpA n=2 Tax=Myxococcus xanthus TaxID=34 RepID=MLPA_MYXXA|nr:MULTISPECIES: hypothetical protein [Myxococcus]P38371.1 RecName: Full=Putative lipoprotein MlpA; Flags: Precursor [Myxococcus xanthus]AAB27615.1 MlpA [Myxococcus xanthus]ABF90347.1 putative lipoprotein MlpA [Myxococcus xanthus DK 1622]NOJ55803.1 hypothetical protein [Myxococcus xanthus]QDE88720.1 hypothetical protein BHS06_06860 [Myxococcus xanthus]QPM81089.1 hypothetical protein I5Q59_07240 [Myxococcus xanthus]
MTKNIVNTALVLVGAGSLLTGCNFEQPETNCFVQESPSWAVKYDVVDSPKDANGDECTTTAPLVELMGVYKYVNPETGAAQLALRPATLASRAIADTTTTSADQTSLGSLDTEPKDHGFCHANDFAPAFVNVAASDTAAANTIRYEFTNVRVYSAAVAPGTQFTGELKYTSNGCTSSYVMRAVWPPAPCDTASTEPAENCGVGSGLNPEFAVVCQPTSATGTTGYCVPAGDIPSFK